ncbi:12622_t:CDS:1, partial [Funneliformis mosseae]
WSFHLGINSFGMGICDIRNVHLGQWASAYPNRSSQMKYPIILNLNAFGLQHIYSTKLESNLR